MPDFPPGLYVVATPIGNLGDLSPRAVAALEHADLIAAEDTRRSARLLAHAGIRTPMQSLHEHNEADVVPALIARAQAGETIALISDAGTPLISDPGFLLVRAAREAAIAVYPVPGPCAAIAALSVSGLPSDRFVFEGFLPAKATARRNRLAELAAETRTLIFYESSHRVRRTVADLAAVLGDERRLTLARELTKLHESGIATTAAALCEWLEMDANRRRGEFVLVVAGAATAPASGPAIDLDQLLAELLRKLALRDVVKIAVRLTGAPRNEVYARAVAVRDEQD